MTMAKSVLVMSLLFALMAPPSAMIQAFQLPAPQHTTTIVPRAPQGFTSTSIRTTSLFGSVGRKKKSWSVTDDWEKLWEREAAQEEEYDWERLANRDFAKEAADSLVRSNRVGNGRSRSPQQVEEDEWIDETVDMIQHYGFLGYEPQSAEEASLFEANKNHTLSFEDEMGKQINLLVRCNELPEDLLVGEGRSLLPLTKEELNDVRQLVTVVGSSSDPDEHEKSGSSGGAIGASYQMTKFFREAVSTMFRQHALQPPASKLGTVLAKTDDGNEHDAGIMPEAETIMDHASVARWMTHCFGIEHAGGTGPKGVISPNDKRVMTTISRFSEYGTGYLTMDNFQHLYLDAVTSALEHSTALKNKNKWNTNQPTVDSVWRDLRAHGIVSPVELEHRSKEAEVRERHGGSATIEEIKLKQIPIEMDECEIMGTDETGEMAQSAWYTTREAGSGNQNDSVSTLQKKSSHELVELASDGKTPLFLRDGDFVFVDEESCIGCKQCAHVSPTSFLMLENVGGRARNYKQANTADIETAIRTCPVSCIHRVSFDELKELETHRDHGDGRTDHKHLSKGQYTPLNVARSSSDQNRKSSWYHYLKHKCHMSKSCPQRGCYACPHYDEPGQNPYFLAKHLAAEHIRAQTMIERGYAEPHRKFAEL